MWIQQCRKLYEEFVERITQRPTYPDRLEKRLAGAKTKRQVSAKELQDIEESSDWPYPDWWPRLSNQFGEPIALSEMSSRKGKQNVVKALQERLRHIEVVSILLRFLCPEEFGIISPPVTGLLNVVSGKEHEQQYLRYLLVLDELRQHYGVFERIADFDMALWTAAHLHHFPGYEAISDNLNQDKDFQKICLKNRMEGFGSYWEGTERERLTLAEVLFKHDHVLAALIAARCFESRVVEMAEQRGITAHMHYIGEKELHTLVRKLERQTGTAPEGISLDALRKFRNTAVHDFKPPISKNDAHKLVTGVQQFWGE